jgi:hypothetical protein
MKAYRRVDVYNHIFLTSALAGGECQLHTHGALLPGKEPPVPIG